MVPAAPTHRPRRSGRFINVQKKGGVVLPPDIRKRLHLDTPGAQVEILEREDGVLELRAHVAVPTDQAWFWTDEWQAGEHEVDEQVAAGQVITYESAEDFTAYLDDVVDGPAQV